MAILKPNKPLKYVKPDGTTQSEYPLTSIDQVIDEDGIHRLNQTIVRADLSDVEEGQVVLTNSDLLENHPASYFIDVDSDLQNTITNEISARQAADNVLTARMNTGWSWRPGFGRISTSPPASIRPIWMRSSASLR